MSEVLHAVFCLRNDQESFQRSIERAMFSRNRRLGLLLAQGNWELWNCSHSALLLSIKPEAGLQILGFDGDHNVIIGDIRRGQRKLRVWRPELQFRRRFETVPMSRIVDEATHLIDWLGDGASFSFSPVAPALAIFENARGLKVYNTETAELSLELDCPSDARDLCYSKDGRWLSWQTPDAMMRLEIETRDLLRGPVINAELLRGPKADAWYYVEGRVVCKRSLANFEDEVLCEFAPIKGGELLEILGDGQYCWVETLRGRLEVWTFPDGERHPHWPEYGIAQAWPIPGGDELALLHRQTGGLRFVELCSLSPKVEQPAMLSVESVNFVDKQSALLSWRQDQAGRRRRVLNLHTGELEDLPGAELLSWMGDFDSSLSQSQDGLQVCVRGHKAGEIEWPTRVSKVLCVDDGWLAVTGSQVIFIERDAYVSEVTVVFDKPGCHYFFSQDGRWVVIHEALSDVLELWNVANKERMWGQSFAGAGVEFCIDERQGLVWALRPDTHSVWLTAFEFHRGLVVEDFCGLADKIAKHPTESVFAFSQGPKLRLTLGSFSDFTFFDGHEADITALSFSPDGSFLVTGDAQGDVYVWKTPLVLKGVMSS